MARVIGWIVFGLIVLWIINNPALAAAKVHGIGTFLSGVTH